MKSSQRLRRLSTAVRHLQRWHSQLAYLRSLPRPPADELDQALKRVNYWVLQIIYLAADIARRGGKR